MYRQKDIKVWVTSDWHFGHLREFCWGPRGFESVEEMNEEIVRRHNEVVSPEDVVICLGDCIMNDQEIGIKYMSQLNGHIYITLGNHDTSAKIEKYLALPNVKDVQMGYRLNKRKISLWFSHHPMLVANYDDPAPVFSIAGHTHMKTKFYDNIPNCYNACLDAHNCYPVLLDNIIDDIKVYRQGK